jgi:DNA-binding NarL/FixJ family response regulator
MKVAIVDDSTIVRERLVTLLSELQGVEIIGQAEDAIEAAFFIRDTNPDVVIMDIRMSGLTGIDLLKNLKKKKPNPVIIMLTNNAHSLYRMKCMNAGAEFFLDKSTEFEKIPDIVKQLLEGRR